MVPYVKEVSRVRMGRQYRFRNGTYGALDNDQRGEDSLNRSDKARDDLMCFRTADKCAVNDEEASSWQGQRGPN
jgi:hypothetical protein